MNQYGGQYGDALVPMAMVLLVRTTNQASLNQAMDKEAFQDSNQAMDNQQEAFQRRAVASMEHRLAVLITDKEALMVHPHHGMPVGITSRMRMAMVNSLAMASRLAMGEGVAGQEATIMPIIMLLTEISSHRVHLSQDIDAWRLCEILLMPGQ